MTTNYDVETWEEFTWEEWIPEEIRKQIERFWGCFGRNPKSWHEDAIIHKTPKLGTRVKARLSGRNDYETGRFIHAWNNMARLVSDDGNIEYICSDGCKVSKNLMWANPSSEDMEV